MPTPRRGRNNRDGNSGTSKIFNEPATNSRCKIVDKKKVAKMKSSTLHRKEETRTTPRGTRLTQRILKDEIDKVNVETTSKPVNAETPAGARCSGRVTQSPVNNKEYDNDGLNKDTASDISLVMETSGNARRSGRVRKSTFKDEFLYKTSTIKQEKIEDTLIAVESKHVNNTSDSLKDNSEKDKNKVIKNALSASSKKEKVSEEDEIQKGKDWKGDNVTVMKIDRIKSDGPAIQFTGAGDSLPHHSKVRQEKKKMDQENKFESVDAPVDFLKPEVDKTPNVTKESTCNLNNKHDSCIVQKKSISSINPVEAYDGTVLTESSTKTVSHPVENSINPPICEAAKSISFLHSGVKIEGKKPEVVAETIEAAQVTSVSGGKEDPDFIIIVGKDGQITVQSTDKDTGDESDDFISGNENAKESAHPLLQTSAEEVTLEKEIPTPSQVVHIVKREPQGCSPGTRVVIPRGRNGGRYPKGNHECESCTSIFRTRDLLREHVKLSHPRQVFKCPHCARHYSQKFRLDKHMVAHELGVLLHCEQCTYVTIDSDRLSAHYFIKHGRVDDSLPEETIELLRKKRGMRKNLREWKCDECGVVCRTPMQYRAHRKTHSPGKFHCKKCGRYFKWQGRFLKHMQEHDEGTLLKCDECDYWISDQKRLDIHVLRHHKGEDVKTYACSICARMFYDKKTLVQHIEKVHSQVLPHKCPECDFKARTSYLLKKHIHFSHELKDGSYPCRLCKSIFKDRTSLQDHIRRHLGQKPFKCASCDAAFSSASQLAQHRQIHKERKSICPVCSKRFPNRFKLARHIVTHTGVKSFTCPFCSYSCNVKSNLYKHCEGVHKTEHPEKFHRYSYVQRMRSDGSLGDSESPCKMRRLAKGTKRKRSMVNGQEYQWVEMTDRDTTEAVEALLQVHSGEAATGRDYYVMVSEDGKRRIQRAETQPDVEVVEEVVGQTLGEAEQQRLQQTAEVVEESTGVDLMNLEPGVVLVDEDGNILQVVTEDADAEDGEVKNDLSAEDQDNEIDDAGQNPPWMQAVMEAVKGSGGQIVEVQAEDHGSEMHYTMIVNDPDDAETMELEQQEQIVMEEEVVMADESAANVVVTSAHSEFGVPATVDGNAVELEQTEDTQMRIIQEDADGTQYIEVATNESQFENTELDQQYVYAIVQ